MPVIRITDHTWDRLKRWAVPLEDTPEDAMRKVLDTAEEHLTCRPKTISTPLVHETKAKRANNGKLRKGIKLPEKAYRHPILVALYELGGSASAREVLRIVEQNVKPLLTEVDYQQLASGVDVRWRNTAQWTRWKLVKDGLLKSDSPSGIWELSNQGNEEAMRLKQK